MGIFSFFKKGKTILRPEDKAELDKLYRNAYMEEAKKLVLEKAKDSAQKDYAIKKDIYA